MRKYLEATLNITKMFENYIQQCKEQNRTAVSNTLFRRVFNNDFNLAFHHPKNDQCTICEKYKSIKPKEGGTGDIIGIEPAPAPESHLVYALFGHQQLIL